MGILVGDSKGTIPRRVCNERNSQSIMAAYESRPLKGKRTSRKPNCARKNNRYSISIRLDVGQFYRLSIKPRLQTR